MKATIRIASLLVLVSGTIVACSNQMPACAGTSKPSTPRTSKHDRPRPSSQRTTSKVQDKPTTAVPRPTSWSGYGERTQRNWTKPYRTGYPVAPQPTIVHRPGGEYRVYPTYSGYYPPGTWPNGYGVQ